MPEIQRVTDPAKRVTDPVVWRQLDREGIDPNFVEFFQDYAPRWRRRPDGTHYRVKECSPFAKFYFDRVSGKRFAVISGLPMVKVEGHKIEPGWLYAREKYYSKANLFSAIVEGKQAQLTCLSDQPDGTKKGARVTYKPQLFIDGTEIINGAQPRLLPTDPINLNYKENTLEWTYGTIAERRIRIFEGRYRDRFSVLSHPHGRVSVKNNCVGDLKLKLGRAVDAEGNPLTVTVIGDEEIVEAGEFDNAVFPVEIGASATFYPDTNAAGVDGWTRHYDVGAAWQTLHDGAGTNAYDTDLNGIRAGHYSWNVSGQWQYVCRALMVIDESDLPPGAVVSATTLSLSCAYDIDNLSISPSFNIYSSDPANPTSLAAGDYNSLGMNAYCDTPIPTGSWVTEDYNDFVFNADPGIVAVQAAADGDTVIDLGVREVIYDVGNSPPAWASATYSQVGCYCVEKGVGYKPKLVITYATVQTVTPSSVPTASSIQAPSVSGSGSAPITLSPVAVPSAVQAPSVSGSGSVSIGPSPVAASSAIQAPSVMGSGAAPVLLSPVQAVSLLQAPGVSGSGIASIYPDPIITKSSVVVPVTLMTCRAPELERELAIALEGKAHFEV